MAGEGIGVSQEAAAVTLANWAKSVGQLTTNKFAFTAALKNKKKIKYKQDGGEIRWPIRYRDHDIQAYTDMGTKTYVKTPTLKNANLEWRGFESTEAVTLMEKKQNRGKSAVVKIFKDRAQHVREGLMRRLGERWHKDGNSTAGVAENRFHGIESFGSFTGQTATDKLATTPNDTYAGQGTGYTSLKSDATAGETEYGAWSPVIVNCNRTVGSTRAWADFADAYLRSGILEASRGAMAEDNLDLILLNKSAYEDLLNIADDKERLVFERGDPLELVKMGFRQFVELDGVMVGWDFGVPAADESGNVVHGYGYNCDRMELKMLNDESLWELHSNFGMGQGADLMLFVSLGNLKFDSPRYHAIFKELS